MIFLSKNSVSSGANEQRYIVTDGTGNLVKDSLLASANYMFHVGRAESDYTPATITNDNGSAPNRFNVQVKDYTESASDEASPERGMHRTWNIFSSLGGPATLVLQHNTSTNDLADYTDNGADANAFVTQYAGAGVWQIGLGATGTDAAGTVAGSRTHTRSYTTTATTQNADIAFFSKSSTLMNP